MDAAPTVPVIGVNELRELGLALAHELNDVWPARENFAAFTKYTKKDILFGWFHQTLCDALDQFLLDVMAGKQPRLMVFAPPRHGKSEVVSRRFPAYALGKFPDLQFIATSYSATLASLMNRDVQRIMDDDPYREVFPGSRLYSGGSSGDGRPARNNERFEIVGNLGSYRCAGVGGGIVGQGFDVGVIDDPIQDAMQAHSETTRASIWEWYTSTFYTRQSPMSGILLIMQRWHEDDLAGRLLQAAKEEGGEQWQVISYPALAEADEQYRKKGEALHPERFTADRLEKMRDGGMGSFTWTSLYQQRPGPKNGTIFKRECWKFWVVRPTVQRIIISVDCAFKDLATSDYVAIQAWGLRGPDKFLLKRFKKQIGFNETCTQIIKMREAFPTCNVILVEDKANGPAVVETLKRKFPAIIAVNPEGGKIARAYAMQPEQESGNIWLPDKCIDPTVDVFVDEASSFPGGAHDDEVDTMTQAINYTRAQQPTRQTNMFTGQ